MLGKGTEKPPERSEQSRSPNRSPPAALRPPSAASRSPPAASRSPSATVDAVMSWDPPAALWHPSAVVAHSGRSLAAGPLSGAAASSSTWGAPENPMGAAMALFAASVSQPAAGGKMQDARRGQVNPQGHGLPTANPVAWLPEPPSTRPVVPHSPSLEAVVMLPADYKAAGVLSTLRKAQATPWYLQQGLMDDSAAWAGAEDCKMGDSSLSVSERMRKFLEEQSGPAAILNLFRVRLNGECTLPDHPLILELAREVYAFAIDILHDADAETSETEKTIEELLIFFINKVFGVWVEWDTLCRLLPLVQGNLKHRPTNLHSMVAELKSIIPKDEHGKFVLFLFLINKFIIKPSIKSSKKKSTSSTAAASTSAASTAAAPEEEEEDTVEATCALGTLCVSTLRVSRTKADSEEIRQAYEQIFVWCQSKDPDIEISLSGIDSDIIKHIYGEIFSKLGSMIRWNSTMECSTLQLNISVCMRILHSLLIELKSVPINYERCKMLLDELIKQQIIVVNPIISLKQLCDAMQQQFKPHERSLPSIVRSYFERVIDPVSGTCRFGVCATPSQDRQLHQAKLAGPGRNFLSVEPPQTVQEYFGKIFSAQSYDRGTELHLRTICKLPRAGIERLLGHSPGSTQFDTGSPDECVLLDLRGIASAPDATSKQFTRTLADSVWKAYQTLPANGQGVVTINLPLNGINYTFELFARRDVLESICERLGISPYSLVRATVLLRKTDSDSMFRGDATSIDATLWTILLSMISPGEIVETRYLVSRGHRIQLARRPQAGMNYQSLKDLILWVDVDDLIGLIPALKAHRSQIVEILSKAGLMGTGDQVNCIKYQLRTLKTLHGFFNSYIKTHLQIELNEEQELELFDPFVDFIPEGMPSFRIRFSMTPEYNKYLKYKNKYLKLKDPNHKLLTPKDISNMSEKELKEKYLKYKNKYNQIKLEKSMNRLKITYN